MQDQTGSGISTDNRIETLDESVRFWDSQLGRAQRYERQERSASRRRYAAAVAVGVAAGIASALDIDTESLSTIAVGYAFGSAAINALSGAYHQRRARIAAAEGRQAKEIRDERRGALDSLLYWRSLGSPLPTGDDR